MTPSGETHPASETHLVRVPFNGFYQSRYEDQVDMALEDFSADLLAEYQAAGKLPGDLEVDVDVVHESLHAHVAFDCVFRAMSRAYVQVFNDMAKRTLGLDIALAFESLDSPSFYNFKNDRIFATLTRANLLALFEKSRKSGHKGFRDLVQRRCRSRSGFVSFYSDRPEDHLARSVLEWDHNLLGLLLEGLFEEALGANALTTLQDVIYNRIVTHHADATEIHHELLVDGAGIPASIIACAELRQQYPLRA